LDWLKGQFTGKAMNLMGRNHGFPVDFPNRSLFKHVSDLQRHHGSMEHARENLHPAAPKIKNVYQ